MGDRSNLRQASSINSDNFRWGWYVRSSEIHFTARLMSSPSGCTVVIFKSFWYPLFVVCSSLSVVCKVSKDYLINFPFYRFSNAPFNRFSSSPFHRFTVPQVHNRFPKNTWPSVVIPHPKTLQSRFCLVKVSRLFKIIGHF